MIAVGSGGIYGKGYMMGTQAHLDFIPERTTDFIFAVYAEEFGLYGGVMLLVLYALLIFRGLAIAARAHTQFGRLLVGAMEMMRSEEHTSELQSLMRISYAVFCLKQKNNRRRNNITAIAQSELTK